MGKRQLIQICRYLLQTWFWDCMAREAFQKLCGEAHYLAMVG